LAAAAYRQLMEHELRYNLKDVPLQTRHWISIQRDGAPPHFGREITDYFNANYEGRRIGRGGPVAWPARSPDLTPF